MKRVSMSRAVIGLAVGMLMLGATSASALNETIESSCDPDCATKPPKENLFVNQTGDLGASGEIATMIGTLAKGKKKTVLRVDMTFEWFSLSAQFRPMTVKVNNKFPNNFLILNHLDACPSGFCVRSMTYWFDIDVAETNYPGQFYGQPLVVTFVTAKTADAGASYTATMAAHVVKKK